MAVAPMKRFLTPILFHIGRSTAFYQHNLSCMNGVSDCDILYVGHLMSRMLLLVQEVGHLMFGIPLPITFEISFSAWIQVEAGSPTVTSLQGFPRIPPVRGPIIIFFGRSPSRGSRLYVIYCHLCTKYELICSFNTFYTWAT